MKEKRTGRRVARGRKGLTGAFFVLVCAVLFGTGGFIVLQNQIAVTMDVRARKVDARIAAERAKQKTLRVTLVRLKSPERVARIARDELQMAEPEAVIYLKYERDASGAMACHSSFEQWSEPPLIREEDGDREGSPTTFLEPPGALSRR